MRILEGFCMRGPETRSLEGYEGFFWILEKTLEGYDMRGRLRFREKPSRDMRGRFRSRGKPSRVMRGPFSILRNSLEDIGILEGNLQNPRGLSLDNPRGFSLEYYQFNALRY